MEFDTNSSMLGTTPVNNHRQHQPFCEAWCRSAAKRQAEVMNDRLQPRCAPRRRRQYPFEALGEDLAPARDGVAAEAASDYQELYDPPGKRQIGHASPIPAMDAPRNCPARWTKDDTSGRPDRDDGLVSLGVRTLSLQQTHAGPDWGGGVLAAWRGFPPQSKRQASLELHQK